jgi:16S rRNA (uracil1498-N3)-methyltransferase
MDELVQRCTELGVQRFVPFHSDRSQGRADKKRRQRREERWLATVKSACKQSGRLTLMEIGSECSFEALLALEQTRIGGLKLLFWEAEQEVRLSDLGIGESTGPVWLMFGPEGGFTEEEVVMARRQGWRTVSLGGQVLRAETATLAAVSIMQNLLGTI